MLTFTFIGDPGRLVYRAVLAADAHRRRFAQAMRELRDSVFC